MTAGSGSTISDCTAAFSTGDGIQVTGDCVVRNNTCDSNGLNGDGAGIHVLSSENRIEANNVTDNDRGIDVDAANNFIVRNSARGNFDSAVGITVNFSIVDGNVVGSINNFPNGVRILNQLINGTGTWVGPWDNFSF